MKREILIGIVLLLGIGLAMAWAEVYPVRWDEPEPLIPAVGPGVVAIGDGGLGLNPDTTYETASFGSNAKVVFIAENDESIPVEERCSELNRGEIRLKVLKNQVATGVFNHLDSLCLCARFLQTQNGLESLKDYQWACFNSDFIVVD